MRWEDLRTDGRAADQLPLALPEPAGRGTGRAGLAVPVTGPIIAGTEDAVAIEVEARSIINRVPAASHMSFRWTINPYRGCTHACRYCLAGDTPVLTGDGRTRALVDLRIGDEIYGTVRAGSHRRYVRTSVLAHWTTVKPAYRVTLDDGTELVASGDHRFLTDRGWKHVTGSMQGRDRRPYLTTGNMLVGTGRFAGGPTDTAGYRRGYLTGMVRGGGAVGSYLYRRPGRAWGSVYRFRLVLADEALDRARCYLDGVGVPTDRVLVRAARPDRGELRAIRTADRRGVETVLDLVRWPGTAPDDWLTGFLAGIFDAAGSCSGSVLRIGSADEEVLRFTAAGLAHFGFRHRIEDRHRPNGGRAVRLSGGLPERLRFFHLTDPAITRKRVLDGLALRGSSRLGVASVEPLGVDLPLHDITTGTGDFIANGVVSHNCFARNTHTYLDLDAGHDFDSKIVVKTNAGVLLRRELAGPRWRGESIAMGTNVDCYQRVEGRYRLMRQILAALRDHANPYSILTKGTLIGRDLDLITQAAEVTDVSVAFSVGFLDEATWRAVEPGTPAPSRRLDLVRRFTDAGIRCSVLMAPILPGLTDDPAEIDRTVAAIAAAGARDVTPLVLHLRPGAREWYGAFLAREHPRLVPRYRRLYGSGSYAAAGYQREVVARVRTAARRHGLGRDDTDHRGFRNAGEAPQPEARQLPLL